MTQILQRHIPYDPLSPRPLPGIAPLDPSDWLILDEAYAGQMARRDALLAERPDLVLALEAGARPAAEELLEHVLGLLSEQGDFTIAGESVTRPDGIRVPIQRDDPMRTLGRLVQDDLCLMEKRGDEHVLTGAVLCFPASWTLAEKFMRPLIGIHIPVDSYDDGMARRVQRLFDGVQVGRPLWRFNALWYADPELHQPRREDDRRSDRHDAKGAFMRSERQALMRLPKSGAVVFSIHTFVVARTDIETRQG